MIIQTVAILTAYNTV